MKKHLKRLIIVLLIILVGFIGLKILKLKKGNNAEVLKTEVTTSSMKLEYNLKGRVQSSKEIEVFSNSIATVKKINFRTGEQVNKGDVLLELESENESINELNKRQSELLLNRAKKEYDDTNKLYKIGAASKDELEIAKINYNDMIIKNKINEKELKKSNKQIISPVSGVILETKADLNYTIDARVPLFKIADTENLQIMLEIENYRAKNLKEGLEVNIKSESLDPDVVLKGVIESISKTSFEKTKSEYVTRVVVKLNDFATLKPGDLVEANVVYKNIEDKIIIPFQYIVNENDKNYVFVVKDGVVDKKEIKIGDNDGINYEIKSGLSKGETILYNTNNQFKLGDKIK